MRSSDLEAVDVEDAVQDVFRIATEKAAGFDGASADAWLRCITEFVSRNAHRRVARNRRREVLVGLLPDVEAACAGLAHSAEQEAIVITARTLGQMSQRDRAIVRKHFSGSWVSETAIAVGLSRAQTYRQLKLLKALLERNLDCYVAK